MVDVLMFFFDLIGRLCWLLILALLFGLMSAALIHIAMKPIEEYEDGV